MNIRKKDNLAQGVFILISVFMFAAIGAIWAAIAGGRDFPLIAGVLVGGFVGLVIGLLASGIFLMIYRAARHAKIKHD